MNQKTLCRYNKFGYCKFSDKCRFRHNNDLCVDKNCNVFKCDKRHPKICTFHRDFGRCKFTTYCRYNHEKQTDVQNNCDMIKKFEKKLTEMENKINPNETNILNDVEKQNEKIENLEKMVKNLQDNQIKQDEIFENKIDSMENILKTLREAIAEKDSEISNLEVKIDNLKAKLSTEEKSDKKKEKNKIKCSVCDFTSKSEQGLKTHMKRKHTNFSAEKYPKNCDLCESVLENESELKSHMKVHSYSEMKFKCEDCDFWGENELTMEVHTGKYHSEIIECGLCEFKATDLEILNTHISTCEIYECNSCWERVRNIHDLKKHILEKHKGTPVDIVHGKIHRKDNEKIDISEHKSSMLFR